ncbi:MAG: hypothetical protein ACK5LS_13155 [Propioniciclava sp.]
MRLRRDQQWWVVTVALGRLIAGFLAWSLYLENRFLHHARTVDARIVETVRTGCFTAAGGSQGRGSGDTVYAVEFLDDGRLIRTRVTRPCRVIPPDFGRGRGAVWIEYDRDHPDRNRVVNDHRVEQSVTAAGIALLGYVAAVGLRLAWPAIAARLTRGRRGRSSAGGTKPVP